MRHAGRNALESGDFPASALRLLLIRVKAGGATFPVFILLLWYVFGRGFRARFFYDPLL